MHIFQAKSGQFEAWNAQKCHRPACDDWFEAWTCLLRTSTLHSISGIL